MKEIGYILAKVRTKFSKHKKETMCEYFRRSGMHIGKDCNICCNIMTSEPYLIEIGNNVTISGNVTFVTHDNCVCKLFGNGNDLYGKIHIGDNCFIGMNTSIMYGVNLPASVIVGCGSVVTSSPEREGVVIAGNPARVIGDVDTFGHKFKDKVIYTGDCNAEKKKRKVLSESGKWIEK